MKRVCLSCGRKFSYWESKIQHVTHNSNSECYSHGVNNIEQKLSTEMYCLWSQNQKIRKGMYHFHLVVERMIDHIGQENVAYSSNVPELTLNVPMHPPDYFTQLSRDKFDSNDVLIVD